MGCRARRLSLASLIAERGRGTRVSVCRAKAPCWRLLGPLRSGLRGRPQRVPRGISFPGLCGIQTRETSRSRRYHRLFCGFPIPCYLAPGLCPRARGSPSSSSGTGSWQSSRLRTASPFVADVRPCQHLRALGVAGGAGDLPQIGPDTEQRRAMLTVSVQEYDIADVRAVFGEGAE